MTQILQTALTYHRHGLAVIPIEAGTKRPPARFKWKRYQTTRSNEAELRRWFGDGGHGALAVIAGDVSGGVVIRDFDVQEGYDRWQRGYPELASALPTVATSRGRHVYFRAEHRGIVKLDDGELRGGGYCLAPPSRHPSGSLYTWLHPLPDGPLPVVKDVRACGLVSPPHVTESTETTETTEAIVLFGGVVAVGGVGFPLQEEQADFERIIKEALPAAVGHRNWQVFELARALKAVPWLADAPADRLEMYVRQWHHLGVAQGVIATVPFEETKIDFLRAWPKVRHPKGTEPMTEIIEKAKANRLPIIAERYEQQGLRLLVGVCRELQQAAGDRPFFLACRTAAHILGVDHVQAWRWLFLLQADKVIIEAEKGSRGKRRASRFKYFGD